MAVVHQSRKVLGCKSIINSSKLNVNNFVDDKDTAAPVAFFFRSLGDIGGCEAVTFAFLGYLFV
jgi:hypothetical protein